MHYELNINVNHLKLKCAERNFLHKYVKVLLFYRTLRRLNFHNVFHLFIQWPVLKIGYNFYHSKIEFLIVTTEHFHS